MANSELLQELYDETRQIIDELLADGSDPEALHTIEHHLASENFDLLEKAAVDAFKLGYEVTDPEEFEEEDGTMIICCDVIAETVLNVEAIEAQVKQIFDLAERYEIEYEGWGTYFQGANDEQYDDEDEYDEEYEEYDEDEEDTPTTH